MEYKPTEIRFLCRTTVIILAIGLLIRYTLGFFLTYTYDIHSWAIIISNMESGNGLYGVSGYNYAPVWGYILGFFSQISEFFGMGFFGERITDALFVEDYEEWFLSAYATGLGFNFAIKTMLFMIDIVTGYVLWWIVADRYDDRRKADMAFCLWFLCPFVISVSAVGAIFDALSALLTMIAIAFMVRGKYFPAGFVITTVSIMKLFPGLLVFLLCAYVLKKHGLNRKGIEALGWAVAGGLVAAIIILLPNILEGTFVDCFGFILNRATSGMGALMGNVVRYGTILAYCAILIVSIILAYQFYHKKDKNEDADGLDNRFLYTVLMTFAVLFLFPATPQYILLITPFLIMACIRNRAFMKPFIILMIGTTMFSISMNTANLLSISAYTDLMSLSTYVSLIGMTFDTGFNGITVASILYYGGAALQWIGILATVILTYTQLYESQLTLKKS